jgi:hypothetical protein
MMGAFDAAVELWSEAIRHGGALPYSHAVNHLAACAGPGNPFTFNGRLHPAVVDEFWWPTRDIAVWSMSLRGWRYRLPNDPPLPCRRVP